MAAIFKHCLRRCMSERPSCPPLKPPPCPCPPCKPPPPPCQPQCLPPCLPPCAPPCPPKLDGTEGYSDMCHPDGGHKIFKIISLYVALPLIALCAINCFLEHQAAPPFCREYIEYEYLNIRTKRFPWGDGNHSFFHNPHKNALPGGYEPLEEE